MEHKNISNSASLNDDELQTVSGGEKEIPTAINVQKLFECSKKGCGNHFAMNIPIYINPEEYEAFCPICGSRAVMK